MSAKERFEAWAGCAINLSKDSDGEYWLTSTRTAWLAWQEAEREMIERCEELVEGYAKNNTDLREAIRALGADNAT